MPGYRDVDEQLVIIGGGAAGLAAVRTARRRDRRVTLVSDGPLGGDCTFTGCVPSKTLLSGARSGASFTDAMARVAAVVAWVAAEDDALARDGGAEVVQGRGAFVDARTLRVGGASIRSERFVLATGSHPLTPSIPGLVGPSSLTTDRLFELDSLPARLVVLGGGPIGVEMAEAFARFGSRVTLLEALPRLLAREEPEASEVVGAMLTSLGVRVVCDSTCVAVTDAAGTVRLELDDGTTIECDAVLVAVGRRASSDGLALERAGVRLDASGAVVVDARLRTSARHIYACGDVSQTLQFTHVADETGRIAASNALSRVALRRFHPEWTPMVTYTALEVARVGVTERDAPVGARVAFLPMSEFDRARMEGEDRGFVKLIAGPRRLTGDLAGGSILGATIVAPRAGEMIQEVVLAMRAGLFSARLAMTTHAYPSWSTAVQLTAAQFFGEFGGRSATGRTEGPVSRLRTAARFSHERGINPLP